MPRLRARRGSRRRIARWIALGVAVLLALLYYRPVRAYVDTRHTLQVRTAEVHALSTRKHQLEERLAEIRSGGTLVRGRHPKRYGWSWSPAPCPSWLPKRPCSLSQS